MKVVIASLNPAIERLLVVARNEPGTVHRLLRSETLAGGKGVNVARVLTQLGTPGFSVAGARVDPVDPVLVGPSGGPTGELEEHLLAEEGLRTATMAIAGWTRTNEVLIDESAPESATVYNAPGPALTPEEVSDLEQLAARQLSDAAFLICTGSLPPGLDPGFYGSWIAQARESGIPTLLDTHGEALARGAAAVPTVIKVNRDELTELAASAPDAGAGTGTMRDRDATDGLIASWLESGVGAVIVTDGAHTATAHTRITGRTMHWEFDTPEVPTRSAVGSGDAFTAGLVWSLLAEQSAGWRRHLAVAAACGASNAAGTLARLSPDLPPAVVIDRVIVREK
ncbi:1-phosphofructokinase family hexose kinase [Herbiconiux solani]|uniref:1-phosphofructokinase family hexose kinase n=1 Tax=Herbiconiux solani TaxID=661329 RepID=UPI0008264886|nr:PfkB family carbohydrate kinase [Herbiconiux solani]